METIVARRKFIRDQPPYFLAGHSAPAGLYREMQTGRELQMKEEGILPATCDGHVAVYIRQPLTWAEMEYSKKGSD